MRLLCYTLRRAVPLFIQYQAAAATPSELVGQWWSEPNFRGDAVNVVLPSENEGRALEDALGQELGADEGELGGPLEEHQANVAFCQLVVPLCSLAHACNNFLATSGA